MILNNLARNPHDPSIHALSLWLATFSLSADILVCKVQSPLTSCLFLQELVCCPTDTEAFPPDLVSNLLALALSQLVRPPRLLTSLTILVVLSVVGIAMKFSFLPPFLISLIRSSFPSISKVATILRLPSLSISVQRLRGSWRPLVD